MVNAINAGSSRNGGMLALVYLAVLDQSAMRWVVGGRAYQRFAALTSQMGRFETKWLSRPEKPAALADLPTPRGSTMCTKRRKARYPRL